MNLLNDFNIEKLWDTRFWLPSNVTWTELNEYTQFDFKRLISVCITFALVVYLIRLIFEKFVATPIGKYFNVADRVIYKPNSVLETYYAKNRVITDSVVMLISKDTGIEFEECKKWLKARSDFNKFSQLEKFNETSWKFTAYLFLWSYGFYILFDKEWIWDTRKCWENWPKQYMTHDLYIYYITEISFYFSLLVSQFYDIKRKDFWQMFLHHIVTILLLLFSYMCNFIRIGSIVLLLHDTADPLMEFAKIGRYCSIKYISEIFFVLFTICWLCTRLTLYPYIVLYSTTFEAPSILEPFNSYYYFNVLLYILQLMHIIWFYMILRIIYNKLVYSNLNDCRESDDGQNDNAMPQHKEHKE